MLKQSVLTLSLILGMGAIATPAAAQSDVSPVLLLESVPSDNPAYRRMMVVSYLNGDSIRVSYKAYNRSEFIQINNTTPRDVLAQCAGGAATSFNEIRSFERAEARRKRNGQAPEPTKFCVKNVRGWESQGNRKKYLDPIFNGMPYAASLNDGT